jgi:hypothetical protein
VRQLQTTEDLANAERAVAELKRRKAALGAVLAPNILAMLARREYESYLKMRDKRTFIVKEIVATEATFCEGLLVMLELFAQPIEAARQKGAIQLSDHEVKALFPEIQTIYNYNKDLLQRLQWRVDKWRWTSGLGDVFLETIPFLKMYTNYVNLYPNAVEMMKKHYEEISAFTSIVDKAHANERCKKHDIYSFLITPIQRVPRYVLLLDDLLKNTPAGHCDYDALTSAHAEMKRVAVLINERKRDAENFQVLLGIYNTLEPPVDDLVQPHRYVVCRGALTDYSDKKHASGKLYNFVLFNDLLLKTSFKSTVVKKGSRCVSDVMMLGCSPLARARS